MKLTKRDLVQKLIARQVILGYVCESHVREIDRIKERCLYLSQEDLESLIEGYEHEMRRLCRIEPAFKA